LIVFPSLTDVPGVADIARLDSSEKLLLMAFAAVVLGLILSSLSTPLYRLLEGYSWPQGLRRWGVRRQLARKETLKRRAEKAAGGWEQALLLEKLHRYPVDVKQVVPTRLGNAVRAFETYGVNRYNLDSQSFWTHMLGVVPDNLRDDVAKARTAVDFFVCLIYLSVVFGMSAVLTAFLAPRTTDWALVAAGLIALGLPRIWYHAALSSTTYWDAAVRALVDVGRKPLAEALGLQLPETIEGEREMWSLVAAFGFYEYDSAWSGKLDPFRVGAGKASSNQVASEDSRRGFAAWLLGQRRER
jgi:hypothetical protein